MTVCFIILSMLYLLGCLAYSFVPDYSRWKTPLRFRAEKKRAWEQARRYGREYHL